MRKLMLYCAMLPALAFVVLTAPAQAQSYRTWVSASGTDSGTCPQTTPCATFAYALGKTTAGGEINCLSSGDFGPVTITGSITIDCGAGNVGRVDLPGNSNPAIYINSSSAVTIILRHLSLNGFGADANGIGATIPSGTLVIEHCEIVGFNKNGIFVETYGGRGILEVSDTVVSANNEGIGVTAYANNTGNVIASVVLDEVKLNANGDGLTLQGMGIVAGTLRHSVVAENSAYGIVAGAGQVFFTVEESSIVDNLTAGIQAISSASNLEVGASTIGGNGTGVSAQFGAIYSFGNNQMSANATNGTFTPGGPGLQ